MSRLVLLGILLGIVPGVLAQDDARSPAEEPEILRKLKALDSAFLAGFQISGTEIVPPAFNAPQQPKVSMKWAFTFGGRRSASQQVAQDFSLPRFDSSPEGSAPQIKGLFTRIIAATQDDRLVLFQTQTNFSKTADKEPEPSNDSHVVHILAPDKPPILLPNNAFLWAAGRGFAQQLDRTTRVEESAEGRVIIEAIGHHAEGSTGQWRLQVEPKSSYIVREAEYTPRQAAIPSLRMTNTGLKVVGACEFPEHATWTTKVANPERTTQIDFTTAALQFDEELFQSASASVKEPFPPHTVVWDERTRPIDVYQIDAKRDIREKAQREEAVADRPRLARGIGRQRAYLLFALNALAVAIFLIGRRWMSRRTLTNSSEAPR